MGVQCNYINTTVVMSVKCTNAIQYYYNYYVYILYVPTHVQYNVTLKSACTVPTVGVLLETIQHLPMTDFQNLVEGHQKQTVCY